MQLLGSTTSPFVRRIRLYLHGQDYEFINLDIFAPDDRATLTANNPALKVPVLIDQGHNIYDSRVIYRYLAHKFGHQQLSWEQENWLTLIDAASDSFVTLLISKRSGFDVGEDKLLFKLQNERVDKILNTLDEQVAADQFGQWRYPAICLFCLLDWINFRDLFDFSHLPHLMAFYQSHLQQAGIEETDPR
ncbi:glutathione S-transferase family protein [Thalassomonas actiniarum]|uniref:Glutathione S-transferase family protein n=1 Tax=Thalassomonas actiniarum TaxID=485447 RepID=A0AAE9YRX1_9GAMM|nr:glutathione S-transferase family protein [Thalassomonas actiniarum]WDD99582.1 glutathione S-transferase family protein [Thalassomonas actiniarum]